MTEQEAINELVDYIGDVHKTTISIDAVTMARKALENQKKIKEIFNKNLFDDDISSEIYSIIFE